MYKTFELLLKLNGCRVADVARATGIGKSTFTDWKQGRTTPKAEKLQKIADYFGVSVDYLLTGQAPETAAAGVMSLSDLEQQLVALFRQLNEKGQGKALELVKLLLLDAENKPVKPAKLAVENLAEAK